MTDLNFFGKDKRPVNGSGSENKNFNVIVADTRWETFEALSDINKYYNFLNLSSEFAVNFILDYEKIDVIIIGTKIGGLEAIAKKSERKKIKVYVLGKDLSYPIDSKEVLSIIQKEYDKKTMLGRSNSGSSIRASFEKIFKFGPNANNTGSVESADLMTADTRHGNKKHNLKKPAYKKTLDIWGANTEHIYTRDEASENENIETADFGDTNIEGANMQSENTNPVNAKTLNTNPIALETLYTENVNTKPANIQPLNTKPGDVQSINIKHANVEPVYTENANKNPANTELSKIWPEFIDTKNIKSSGADYEFIESGNFEPSGIELQSAEPSNFELASKKPANKKPDKKTDKDQDKKSQFYNDFWKEVIVEAGESHTGREETRKPNHNMHEYGKNIGLPSSRDFSGNTKVENESLVPPPGKVITIKQKTMVFVKAKGGVGSTYLSLYLAYEFRKLRTLLIDLNFSEGGSDIGYYLGMPKTPNMVIFTDGYNRLSMDNSVISFNGHFDILQPPPSYDLTKKLDMQDIYSIVDIARRKYHLLIFDLPNQIDDIFLGVLDMADLAIMVSDYTSGSIGRLANINKRFIYNDMERILVLNKNNNNGSHSFIKNNISEFFSLKEIVNINENPLLSGKSDFKECDFSNNKDMQGFKNKVMDSLTCD